MQSLDHVGEACAVPGKIAMQHLCAYLLCRRSSKSTRSTPLPCAVTLKSNERHDFRDGSKTLASSTLQVHVSEMCYGTWLILAEQQCSIGHYDMQASSFLCHSEVSMYWIVEHNLAATVVLMQINCAMQQRVYLCEGLLYLH